MTPELAHVNLNLLASLDTLLAERSVTRAARRAGVTQSAMSQSLAQLRALFGDELLVRVGNGMMPTARAAHIAPELRRHLRALSTLLDATVDDFDPARAERRVVIAAPDVIALRLLPSLRAAIGPEAPQVMIDFAPVPERLSADRLENGEIDFLIHVTIDRDSGLRTLPLFRGELVAVLREDHPRAPGKSPKLGIRAFCEIPHVVVGTGDHLVASTVDAELSKLGRSRRIAMRVAYFLAAPFVAARTDLLWCGPKSVVDSFRGALPVRAYKLPIAQKRPALKLFWHDRFNDDPFNRWFRDKIGAVLGQRRHVGIAGKTFSDA